MKSVKSTFAEIRTVVADNEKQRFSLIHISTAEPDMSTDTLPQNTTSVSPDVENDEDPSHYLIRANQGHSIQVDTESLLTPITLELNNAPEIVVHGTRYEHWPKIIASGGLKTMGRNHVHFATGVPEPLKSKFSGAGAMVQDCDISVLPGDKKTPMVLSGMRNSSSILIFIDLRRAIGKGLKFWLSENGVVLSDGDENGLIPVEVFEKVEERGGRVLVKDGQIVSQMEKIVGGDGRSSQEKGGLGGG